MESLQISFLLKASVLQSKAALMVCFPSLLVILLLAFTPPLESTLLLTIWHALSGFFEEPALAFLLLNCVTLTIIATSKLGSEKRGHEEKGQGRVAMKLTEKGDEKGDDVLETVIGVGFYLDTPVENGHQMGDDVAESVVRPSLYLHTPVKTGHDISRNKEGNLLRRSWSLNASFEYKTRQEQVKPNHNVKDKSKEKKLVRSRGRLGSRRNEKVGLHPSKPLSTELQKEQLISPADGEGTHYDEKPALNAANCDSTTDEQCAKACSERAGDVIDQGPRQAGDPAPAAGETAHPSMDEVWAAIMSSKKEHDCMASCMQAKKRSKKPNSKTVKKQPQPAAATSAATQCPKAAPVAPPAAAEVTPPAAATAATSPPKSPGKVQKSAKRAHAAAAKEYAEGGNGRTELDELNHRADEFIGRFNRQMRLQREESLQQRQKLIRGRRACNYDVQYSHNTHSSGLGVPVRGLLVG